MAWTAADRDALKLAIATGASKVRYGSGDQAREVEYRSLADMERTLALIEADLAGASSSGRATFAEIGRF